MSGQGGQAQPLGGNNAQLAAEEKAAEHYICPMSAEYMHTLVRLDCPERHCCEEEQAQALFNRPASEHKCPQCRAPVTKHERDKFAQQIMDDFFAKPQNKSLHEQRYKPTPKTKAVAPKRQGPSSCSTVAPVVASEYRSEREEHLRSMEETRQFLEAIRRSRGELSPSDDEAKRGFERDVLGPLEAAAMPATADRGYVGGAREVENPYAWLDDIERRRYNKWQILQGILLLLALTGMGFGIYFSVLTAPFIISALIAAGILPEFAFILGVLTSFGLIAGALSLSTFALFSFYKLFIANYRWLWSGKSYGVLVCGFNLLLGISAGSYFSAITMPFLLNALLGSGLSYGLAVCVGVVASIVVVEASIELLMAFSTFYCFLGKSRMGRYLEGILPRDWLGRFTFVLGLGLGIYLTTLIAPLLFAVLPLAPALITAVLSFALIRMTVKAVSAAAVAMLNVFQYGWFIMTPIFQTTHIKNFRRY